MEPVEHVAVQRVQLLGAVEGDPGGRAAGLVQDGIAHAGSFRTIRQSSATARSRGDEEGVDVDLERPRGARPRAARPATIASISACGGAPSSRRPSAGSDPTSRRAPASSSGARRGGHEIELLGQAAADPDHHRGAVVGVAHRADQHLDAARRPARRRRRGRPSAPPALRTERRVGEVKRDAADARLVGDVVDLAPRPGSRSARPPRRPRRATCTARRARTGRRARRAWPPSRARRARRSPSSGVVGRDGRAAAAGTARGSAGPRARAGRAGCP